MFLCDLSGEGGEAREEQWQREGWREVKGYGVTAVSLTGQG